MTTLNGSNYEPPTLDAEAETSRPHFLPNVPDSAREPNRPSLEDEGSIFELYRQGTQICSQVTFNQADVNVFNC